MEYKNKYTMKFKNKLQLDGLFISILMLAAVTVMN